MRLYQEHSIENRNIYTFLGATVIILTSSLLKRVDLSVDILSPSIWAKVKGTDVRGANTRLRSNYLTVGR